MRRFGASPGPSQRFGCLHAGRPKLRRVCGQSGQRELVEIRRLIEGQLFDRVPGGPLRVGGCPRGLPGVEPVPDDGLGVHERLCLVGLRDAAMMSAERFGRQPGHDGLPDPIVRRLDPLSPVTRHDPHEAPRLQIRQAPVDVVARARGVPQDRRGHGAPVRRDELQEVSRLAVEVVDALLDHLLERRPGVENERVRVRLQALGSRASGEVLDEERASARAASDGVGDALRGFVLGAHEVEGETPRVVEPERVDDDAPHVDADEALLEELLQKRAGLGVHASPLAEDEQEPRGVRRSHHLLQQGRAVDVAPVNVVEVQDQSAGAGPAPRAAHAARRTPAGARPAGHRPHGPAAPRSNRPAAGPERDTREPTRPAAGNAASPCCSRAIRQRLSASTTPSIALYATDSRSYAHPRRSPHRSGDIRPSRKC